MRSPTYLFIQTRVMQPNEPTNLKDTLRGQMILCLMPTSINAQFCFESHFHIIKALEDEGNGILVKLYV